MGKITIEVILKVMEVIGNIIVVVRDSIKGRNKDDSTGSTQKKRKGPVS
jgi:hypothetical protein